MRFYLKLFFCFSVFLFEVPSEIIAKKFSLAYLSFNFLAPHYSSQKTFITETFFPLRMHFTRRS